MTDETTQSETLASEPTVSPWGPCPDCLQDSTSMKRERNTGVIACYCHHNKSGS